MPEPDRCELHEAAVVAAPSDAGDLVRLSQSPIGDECQFCPVCRAAREFVERRLAETTGYVPPAGESANESWAKLQTAIRGAKVKIHPGA